MGLRLYLLERVRTDEPIHAVLNKFVVAASTEDSARRYAAEKAADEKAFTWVDPQRSTIRCIAKTTTETSGVVCAEGRDG